MFKAVHNIRERKGFTLIELLIVIAIIGILAAIAIPAFLGQREKAKQRSLEGSAKGAVSEVQATIDDFVTKTALVFLTTGNNQMCFEFTAAIEKRKCSALYPDLTSKKYTADLKSILSVLLAHHNIGKEEKSPYDGTDLFTSTATSKNSHVYLTNKNNSSAIIQAWSDTGVLLLNVPVSAR